MVRFDNTLVVAICLLATACGDSGRGASQDAASGAPLAIKAEARLSVGVLEGDPRQQFGRLGSPFLLPDGRLAVPDEDNREIRVFDAFGDFVRAFGGEGEGPGEFVDLSGAWARGDTIEAYDRRQQRITRFSPNGDAQVVTLRGAPASLDRALGPLGAGWAMMSLGFGDARDQAVVHRFGPDGVHMEEIAAIEGMERVMFDNGGGPHPLTPTAILAVHRGRVYVADALVPTVRVYATDDTVVREIQVPVQGPGPPADVLAAVIDSAVARAEETRKDAVRDRWSVFAPPDAVPVLWSLLVDARGYLWVRPYDPFRHSLPTGGNPGGRPGPGGVWIVMAPDGSIAARVPVPDGLEPTAITDDAVVGIHQDDLGVERVEVHSLARVP